MTWNNSGMGCRPSRHSSGRVADSTWEYGKRQFGEDVGTKQRKQKQGKGKSRNTRFCNFSSTTRTYQHGESRSSRITLRLSTDGSVLEIEQYEVDFASCSSSSGLDESTYQFLKGDIPLERISESDFRSISASAPQLSSFFRTSQYGSGSVSSQTDGKDIKGNQKGTGSQQDAWGAAESGDMEDLQTVRETKSMEIQCDMGKKGMLRRNGRQSSEKEALEIVDLDKEHGQDDTRPNDADEHSGSGLIEDDNTESTKTVDVWGHQRVAETVCAGQHNKHDQLHSFRLDHCCTGYSDMMQDMVFSNRLIDELVASIESVNEPLIDEIGNQVNKPHDESSKAESDGSQIKGPPVALHENPGTEAVCLSPEPADRVCRRTISSDNSNINQRPGGEVDVGLEQHVDLESQSVPEVHSCRLPNLVAAPVIEDDKSVLLDDKLVPSDRPESKRISQATARAGIQSPERCQRKPSQGPPLLCASANGEVMAARKCREEESNSTFRSISPETLTGPPLPLINTDGQNVAVVSENLCRENSLNNDEDDDDDGSVTMETASEGFNETFDTGSADDIYVDQGCNNDTRDMLADGGDKGNEGEVPHASRTLVAQCSNSPRHLIHQ